MATKKIDELTSQSSLALTDLVEVEVNPSTSPASGKATLSVLQATFTKVGVVTVTQPATGATLTLANGSVLATSGAFDITFTATASTALTLPTSGTLTTTANTLAVFAATTSAQLAGVISDETGSGSLVFANTPTLVTPVLGVATATSINGLTITSSTGVLTITNAKTLSVSNTLTFTGTDASSVAFGTGGTVTYTSNKLSVFAATTSAELAGVISDETGSGSLVFANTPTLVTPVLGVATATSINGLTITSSTGTLTITNGKTATFSNTLTFSGTDAKALVLTTGLTVTTNDGTIAFGASGKTLTVSDSTTLATNAITMGGGEVITFSATNALSLLTTGATVMTFPATTDTVVTLAATQTLTNKRVTQRVTTTTDDATSIIDIDTCDVYELSAVANATEFTTTGTPTNGQKLIVRFKDAGVSKALTWTFATAIGVTLPTATTASKWGYVGCTYNSAAAQWHALAVTTQA